MRKYALFIPHLFLVVSTVGLIASIQTDWESKSVSFFWVAIVASLLVVPPISKKSLVLGYVAVMIPFLIFMALMSLNLDRTDYENANKSLQITTVQLRASSALAK